MDLGHDDVHHAEPAEPAPPKPWFTRLAKDGIVDEVLFRVAHPGPSLRIVTRPRA